MKLKAKVIGRTIKEVVKPPVSFLSASESEEKLIFKRELINLNYHFLYLGYIL